MRRSVSLKLKRSRWIGLSWQLTSNVRVHGVEHVDNDANGCALKDSIPTPFAIRTAVNPAKAAIKAPVVNVGIILLNKLYQIHVLGGLKEFLIGGTNPVSS